MEQVNVPYLRLGIMAVRAKSERQYPKWVKGRQDRLDALVSATWTK